MRQTPEVQTNVLGQHNDMLPSLILSLAIACRDNVGLHGRICRVRGVSAGHHTFIERANLPQTGHAPRHELV